MDKFYKYKEDGDYGGEEIRYRALINKETSTFILGIENLEYDLSSCDGCPTCDGASMTTRFERIKFKTLEELNAYVEYLTDDIEEEGEYEEDGE